MIRIDAAWLATAPLDMRAGTDSALARVVSVFGAAQPHHAYPGFPANESTMMVVSRLKFGQPLTPPNRTLPSLRGLSPHLCKSGLASAPCMAMTKTATNANSAISNDIAR